MSLAVVLGSAECLKDDLARLQRLVGERSPVIIAVNESGAFYPGTIHHWATLHPEKLRWWIRQRERSVEGVRFWSNQKEGPVTRVFTPWEGADSGLFGVQVAIRALRLERVIVAGMPMDDSLHIRRGVPWKQHEVHREAWEKALPQIQGRVRSMSGWTREMLGEPTKEWLNGRHLPENL